MDGAFDLNFLPRGESCSNESETFEGWLSVRLAEGEELWPLRG